MLCQQTSPKRWLANVNVTSYCDVTRSECSIPDFGWGHTSSRRPGYNKTSARHWSGVYKLCVSWSEP